MFELRIHGRDGQGVVTAAEMLSVAAFAEGRNAQAFPSFGLERTGAPVVSFCRIADKEIRLREPIMEPDAVIIQDITRLHQVDVFAALSGLIRLESVIKVIGEKFSGKVAHGNIAAATEAYDLIKTRTKEVSIHV